MSDVTRMLEPVSLNATTEYSVFRGGEYVVNLGAYATLEFWNGTAWKEYPSASGGTSQDKDFVFDAPASGLIRVVIGAGKTSVAGFYPKD